MIYLDDMPLSGSAAFAALLECDFRNVTAMRSFATALDRACTVTGRFGGQTFLIAILLRHRQNLVKIISIAAGCHPV